MSVTYRGQTMVCGYRLDLLVEGLVVVEVKPIERFERVHSAQLLSYLRFAKCKVGLLFNFNVKWLVQDGLKRVVNGFPECEVLLCGFRGFCVDRRRPQFVIT